MTDPAVSAFLSARANMADVLSQWGLVPLRTAEVGDYAVRFRTAEVCILYDSRCLLC